MTNTGAFQRGSNRRLTHLGAVGLVLAALVGLACGLQRESGGSGGGAGSGGQSQVAGGQTTAVGGQTTATAGQTMATGGQTMATAGQTMATGGQATASGGQTMASGGQTTASGGQTTVTGGQIAGSAGRATSSGGQTTATGGQTTATGGRTASSGGQTTLTGGQTAGSAGRTTSSGGQTAASGGVSGTGGKSAATGGASTGGSSGGGGASGAGVTINGKFVPKDKAVVFIHFGHSNMRGAATTPTSLTSYFYDTVDGLWSYKGSFTLAKEPTAPQAGYTSAGPGMAILHSAQGAVAATSDVQFISVGYGQGSATTVDYQKSGLYYPVFMGWAGQLKGNVTFGAIVIMLGVTDGEHLASNLVPGFPARVVQLVSDIRSDLGEPNLPVLFCDYEQNATGQYAITGAIGTVMVPLIKQLPGLISNLVLVPTDGIEMQDNHHFDLQGHKDWAGRVISLMQSNNWFPWQ
ncbi:MAG: sialate O-acetylesterase [Polyangia bacterium]